MGNYESFDGVLGATITACRNAETFIIRINDANDVQIGIIPDVKNVPHGLMLAEGWVYGYYAGRKAEKRELYQNMRIVFCGVDLSVNEDLTVRGGQFYAGNHDIANTPAD